jgi:hypothetical protein
MASVDGNWKLTVNSPMGQQNIDLSLSSSGSTLTGSLSGQMGSTEIKNGQVDGDSFSFEAQITEPFAIAITVTGEVAGDELKGQVKTQGFGSFPMKGQRA